MDDGGHQAQDAACTLELLDARPVVVEPGKEFRMNRIGGFDAPFVLRLPTVCGKLLGLAAIELHIGPGNAITRNEQRWLGDVLEQSPPYDLEALFSIGRPPGRFNACENIIKPHGRFASTLSAGLRV